MIESKPGWLRFSCVWEDGRPGLSSSTWTRLVSRITGFAVHELPVEAPGQVANVWRCSLSVVVPHEVPREQRAAWTRDLEAELAAEIAGGYAVAITAGEMAKRGPALVVMDADSTLFAGEGIDLVAARAGTEVEVAAITAAAMHGELDFAGSLRARMATLAGLPVDELTAVRANYVFSPGAREMIAAFRRNGTRIGVVSGGFMELVEKKARTAGVDSVLANRFEVTDGVLTGKPLGDIVTADSKRVALERWASEIGVSPESCVAMGDGANDLKMLARAGFGIAFCAKPALAAVADARIPFPNLAAAAALLLP